MEDGVEIQKKIERVFGLPPKVQILDPTAVMSLKSDAEIVTLYVLGDHESYHCDLPYVLKVTEQYYEEEIEGCGKLPHEALMRLETLAPITQKQLDALLALIDSSHKEEVAQILSSGKVLGVEDSEAEDEEEEDSEAEDGEAEDEKK